MIQTEQWKTAVIERKTILQPKLGQQNNVKLDKNLIALSTQSKCNKLWQLKKITSNFLTKQIMK